MITYHMISPEIGALVNCVIEEMHFCRTQVVIQNVPCNTHAVWNMISTSSRLTVCNITGHCARPCSDEPMCRQSSRCCSLIISNRVSHTHETSNAGSSLTAAANLIAFQLGLPVVTLPGSIIVSPGAYLIFPAYASMSFLCYASMYCL